MLPLPVPPHHNAVLFIVQPAAESLPTPDLDHTIPVWMWHQHRLLPVQRLITVASSLHRTTLENNRFSDGAVPGSIQRTSSISSLFPLQAVSLLFDASAIRQPPHRKSPPFFRTSFIESKSGFDPNATMEIRPPGTPDDTLDSNRRFIFRSLTQPS